jgi:hypothetical protein
MGGLDPPIQGGRAPWSLRLWMAGLNPAMESEDYTGSRTVAFKPPMLL